MMIGIPFVTQIPAGFSMQGVFGQDIVQMIIHAGLMAKFVLWVLLIFSIISWAIVFVKLRLFRKAKQDTADFLELFWENRDLKKLYSVCGDFELSPVARLFKAGYSELSRIRKIQASQNLGEDSKRPALPGSHGDQVAYADGDRSVQSRQSIMDNIERSLKRASVDQVNKLERTLSFLATTGNTAPFIGLFGTVWGLMGAFRAIGIKGSANLAVVAPGISEALITTAAGLVVAIPAVVAFNYFVHRVVLVRAEMNIFTSDFLSMVERQFFREPMAAKTDV